MSAELVEESGVRALGEQVDVQRAQLSRLMLHSALLPRVCGRGDAPRPCSAISVPTPRSQRSRRARVGRACRLLRATDPATYFAGPSCAMSMQQLGEQFSWLSTGSWVGALVYLLLFV